MTGRLDVQKTAAELIAESSPFLDRRARELVRHSGRIGHSFAFWFCADYYGTKAGSRIRLFYSPGSSSKPERSRLVFETAETGAGAYVALIEAIERDSRKATAA